MSEFNCKECDRNFNSQEGLEMHNSAKHSTITEEKQGSTKKMSSPVKWGFIIVFIGILIFGFFSFFDKETIPGEYDEFASCLTENGFKMFGAYWCPHCLDQKEMFGNSWEKINYIECSLPNKGGQTVACSNEGVESYPTWEYADGTRVLGVQSFSVLSEASGCPLTEE
jgi:hypothetical protein